MSRSATELGIMFFRAQDGLALLLDLDKWKLERGKAYHGSPWWRASRSVEAKALAESKAVTIALVDQALQQTIGARRCLGEVRGEGATTTGATRRQHGSSRAPGNMLR